jgi:hypothetical protein
MASMIMRLITLNGFLGDVHYHDTGEGVDGARPLDGHMEEWVEKNLDEDVGAYGDRTDEDGLGELLGMASLTITDQAEWFPGRRRRSLYR